MKTIPFDPVCRSIRKDLLRFTLFAAWDYFFAGYSLNLYVEPDGYWLNLVCYTICISAFAFVCKEWEAKFAELKYRRKQLAQGLT